MAAGEKCKTEGVRGKNKKEGKRRRKVKNCLKIPKNASLRVYDCQE